MNEIEEGKKYLENTENIHNPKEKIILFSDGIDLLNLYIDENQNINDPQVNYAKNLKVTYTRSLLNQIENFKLVYIDINTWIMYISVLIDRVHTEIMSIINENEHIKHTYINFINKHNKQGILHKDILLQFLINKLKAEEAKNDNKAMKTKVSIKKIKNKLFFDKI